MFIKYPHVERFGNKEVEGIQNGKCYVFPKIDGTNSSVWWNGDIQAGSRNRHLSLEKDNAGFLQQIQQDQRIYKFLSENQNLTLYGEYLVQHTIKTYRDDAWKRFYIFDVLDRNTGQFLHYDTYSRLLALYDLEFIPCYKIIVNGMFEDFYREAQNVKYLLQSPQDMGEGIVIKNYDFVNEYGRAAIAKIVVEEFKEKFHANVELGGPPSVGSEKIPEAIFLDRVMSASLVKKEFAKLALDGWESKKIGKLLQNVYECLIREELPDEVLRNKYDSLNFGRLRQMSILRVKTILPEVF